MLEREIGENSVVHWSSKAVATAVNDEVVLMNLERDRCYGLGTTGSEVWRKMSTPIRVADLIDQLEREYTSEPGQIQADVLRTLKELSIEGLIEVSTTPEKD